MRRVIRAPRMSVYRALVDGAMVQRWRVPTNMTSVVHEFDARVGGHIRVSLTYQGDGTGKSGGKTDTYHGTFAELVPGERVVATLAFETADPAMQGEMRITWTLRDALDGTELVATHEGVPRGIRPEDNELGWSMAIEKLAAILEGPTTGVE